MTDATLHCPMCGTEMRITDPDDTYECLKCGAWFEMLDYGYMFKKKEDE